MSRLLARIRGGLTLEPGAFKPLADAAVAARLDVVARGKVRVCDLSAKVPGAFEPFRTAYQGAPAAPWRQRTHLFA